MARLLNRRGVCDGFTKVMEMQNVIDCDAGRVWPERRIYVSAIFRKASLMESLPAATDSEINRLVENYVMWLVTNLVADGGGTGLAESAHERTGKMVAELGGTLFTQAGAAISQNLPELMTCTQSVSAATPKESCTAEAEAATVLRERIAALDQKTTSLGSENATLKAETGRLRTDLAMRTRAAEEDDGLVADGLVDDNLAENDTAVDNPADDGVTAARVIDGDVSPPAPKLAVIAQLGSHQRCEHAISGVAILRTKISGTIADISINIA